MTEPQSSSAPPAPVQTPPSTWIWVFARLAVHTFYRVDRIGSRLPPGPLLLVANHPNTLLDPALLYATAGRPIRFLAKSTLFTNPALGSLVRRSGAIPVYRRIDPGVDPTRNVETFSAVEAALAQDEAICLFPEGVSHDRGHLEPLRTGAARMALDSSANGHPVSIVAVGLNFDRMAAFRSRVTVAFGPAFGCADLLDTFRNDPSRAAHELTRRIEDHLRQLMVEAEPRHDLPVVARVDRLYASARGAPRDAGERMRRRHVIARGLDRLRRRDPARLESILSHLREYDADLERFGLRDWDVDRQVSFGAALRFTVREALLAVVLVPPALMSIVVFALPYWITGQVSRIAPDRVSRASYLILGGTVIYAVWVTLLATGVGLWRGGRPALGTGAGLTVLAFVGLVAIERESSVLRAIRAFLALRQTPVEARAHLKRRRAAIATVLEDVRQWLEEEDEKSEA